MKGIGAVTAIKGVIALVAEQAQSQRLGAPVDIDRAEILFRDEIGDALGIGLARGVAGGIAEGEIERGAGQLPHRLTAHLFAIDAARMAIARQQQQAAVLPAA